MQLSGRGRQVSTPNPRKRREKAFQAELEMPPPEPFSLTPSKGAFSFSSPGKREWGFCPAAEPQRPRPSPHLPAPRDGAHHQTPARDILHPAGNRQPPCPTEKRKSPARNLAKPPGFPGTPVLTGRKCSPRPGTGRTPHPRQGEPLKKEFPSGKRQKNWRSTHAHRQRH